MGIYDLARRRQSVRKGRERGCWVYIPKDELVKTGFGEGDPPGYRVWGDRGGRIVIQLYAESDSSDPRHSMGP